MKQFKKHFLLLVALLSSALLAYAANPTLVLEEKNPSGSLQARIAKHYKGEVADLKVLDIRSGELNSEDCKYIKQQLPQLEELSVAGKADFQGGAIPKGAFEGMPALRRVYIEHATKMGSKAFSLCGALEEVDMPHMESVAVQAFAQAKGSGDSRLRKVSLPSLKTMEPRTFYYCTNLETLILTAPPTPQRPVGKEGLWFERVTRMVIQVPDRATYDQFMQVENCTAIDWSAYNFVAKNGDTLPVIPAAPAYDDKAYDHLKTELLPTFDRTDKEYSGVYYTGDFKLSLNLYTFNMNLNAWMNNSSNAPQISTLDAIRWAAKAGFDAVDVTCYYIPGYSNTAMPTLPEEEVLAYARQIKNLCKELGIAISGTGLQNNFADPNALRRKTDVERIKLWIKVAAEMGAPVIRIFAGSPPADIRREGWEKIARERIAPHVREVALFAKEHYPQVRIGLQNHGGMLATANQVIQVLKWVDCDNVGIINDTGFYREFLSTDASKYDWYSDIAAVLPYTNNFQIKKKPAGAETKELMDLHRLMVDIRKSPYRGYLPIELLWLGRDEGYPGKLSTPPYEETLKFLERLREEIEKTRTAPAQQVSTAPAQVGAVTISALFHPVADAPKILGANADHLVLTSGIRPAELATQLNLPQGVLLRVEGSNGIPRLDLEPIQTGDRLVLIQGATKEVRTIAIKHHKLHNWALNPDPARVKVSSFSAKCNPLNAFDGQATGFSGSGYQVDASQASTEGKKTFWLAVDLGEERPIDAFGVAWGTAVGQLQKRLDKGLYRVAWSNDPKQWEALSHAVKGGKAGLEGYLAPKGWKTAYQQAVSELPDANGNKLFIKDLDQPLKARYVMVSAEMAQSGVEIYNFFVYERRLQDGESHPSSLQSPEVVQITPDYPGMVLASGRPAVVALDDAAPAFHLLARTQTTLEARLVNPKGKAIYTLPAITLEPNQVKTLRPEVACDALGCYRMEFKIAGEKPLYDTYYFTAVEPSKARTTYAEPYPALWFDGKVLHYTPDYRGNRLIDYSHAGYGGGGEEIPAVTTKIVLTPSEDATTDDAERIQRAVDLLGRAPLDKNGFRGALLLKSGVFRISRPIRINHSGIVIRGEGDGHEAIEPHAQPLSPTNWHDYTHSEEPEKGITKVVATWKADSYNKNEALFEVRGAQAKQEGEVAITECYVPVGARTLHVADLTPFKVGDNVLIHRAVNALWAHDLSMDVITDAPGVLSANQWTTKGEINRAYQDIRQERTIASIDPEQGTITLVEPIVDPLNRRYGVSTVSRLVEDGRVEHVGVEALQLISHFEQKGTATNSAFGVDYKYFDDECHAQVGVAIGQAKDVWVRRVTTYHIDVATTIQGGARRITLQDMNCLEPVSGTGGERRYSFSNSGGSQVLNQRNYVRYTRHGFIIMGNVMGPNVFLNNRSDYQFDANEPHLRWSTGGLYDNVEGRIYIQNRWNNGTAHGWSGANYTLWNNRGKFIISQSPLAANYLFGQSDAADRLPFVMEEVDPGNVPNFPAYEASLGQAMQPQSLYLQQLKERCGSKGVKAALTTEIGVAKDESADFLNRFAFLKGIQVDGKPIEGFDPAIFAYEIPVALDYTTLPAVTAEGEAKTTVTATQNEREVTIEATKKGCYSNRYTVTYHYVSKAPISGVGREEELAHLTDKNPQTSWSHPGTPYVQFYLGDKPVEIASVGLGYCRNTQSRRQYYFDFEISNDGYNWTKVSHPDWTLDNLGHNHLMGMQLMPGVGNNPNDYETFTFPKGVKARLLRVQMYGARFGRGSGTTNANSYWSIQVEKGASGESASVKKGSKSGGKKASGKKSSGKKSGGKKSGGKKSGGSKSGGNKANGGKAGGGKSGGSKSR